MEKDEFQKMLLDCGEDLIKLQQSLQNACEEQKKIMTIVGVDLYQYSQMEPLKQFVAPFFISQLFENTLIVLQSFEKMFFSEEEIAAIKDSLIDTGDGFYLVLKNPLKAMIFLAYFCSQIEAATSRIVASTLMKLYDDFIFRYSITTGEVFKIGKKYYGDAITKCARIIALDKLNRFLIDRITYRWFYENANGIDALRVHRRSDIVGYGNGELYASQMSGLFPQDNVGFPPINALISQKIGEIQSKQTPLDIFNVYIQWNMGFPGNRRVTPFSVSIGNLNVNAASNNKFNLTNLCHALCRIAACAAHKARHLTFAG
jgi:hypothetical protein